MRTHASATGGIGRGPGRWCSRPPRAATRARSPSRRPRPRATTAGRTAPTTDPARGEGRRRRARASPRRDQGRRRRVGRQPARGQVRRLLRGREGLLRHDQRERRHLRPRAQARRRARRQGRSTTAPRWRPCSPRTSSRCSRSPRCCSPARRQLVDEDDPHLRLDHQPGVGGIGGGPQGEPVRADRLVPVLRLRRHPACRGSWARPRRRRSASSPTPSPSRPSAPTGSRTRSTKYGDRVGAEVAFIDKCLQFGTEGPVGPGVEDEGRRGRLRDHLHGHQRRGHAGQGDEEAATRRGAEPAERLRPRVPRGVRRPVRGLLRPHRLRDRSRCPRTTARRAARPTSSDGGGRRRAERRTRSSGGSTPTSS